VLPGHNRVVQHIIIIVQSGVLKIKLDQLHAVRKGIKWHLFALHNRNKIVCFNFTVMGLVNSNWLQVTFQNIVVFELAHTNATGLPIEKASRVKYGLSLVASHRSEKVSFFGLANHAQRHV
jgi:hypothetical protein